MRILTAGNMYPPHHYGGYELVWASAVAHLRDRGHQVRVLTTDTDTGASSPDDPDVHRILQWPLEGTEFAPRGPVARARLSRHNHRVLAHHLDAFGPDVVSWWSMGGLSLTMLESVRRRALPAVAFVHDEWLDYGRWADEWLKTFTGPRRGWAAPLAERLARIPATVDLGGAAQYVFVSDFVRRHALARGLALPRTAVAHSGIDSAYLEPAAEQPWNWRMLYVGRLDPRKGIGTAIEALTHLPPSATLRILGGWDKAEHARLQAEADRLGVKHQVEFGGQRTQRQLFDAYAEADVVVFPVTWDEPWGLVPLEAMGRGRPVVATGSGGSAEYLRNGENALLFDPGDPQSLADTVSTLAGSPGIRARLREAGFETAQRHTEALFNEEVRTHVEAATARVSAEPRFAA